MARPYDIVIYGASGFTGQFAALEAVRVCQGKKIALGGRTKSKLEEVKVRISNELGLYVSLLFYNYDLYKSF